MSDSNAQNCHCDDYCLINADWEELEGSLHVQLCDEAISARCADHDGNIGRTHPGLPFQHLEWRSPDRI